MDYKQFDFSKFGDGCLPGLLNIEFISTGEHSAKAKLEIKKKHFAPNGYVHAGTIVTLADTIAGYGCLYNLPSGANSFTTIELKSNFMGAAKEGYLLGEGKMQHGGKTTQIWDVEVTSEVSGKTIALFRCTQLLIY